MPEVTAVLAEIAEEEGEGALFRFVLLLLFVEGWGGLEEEGDASFFVLNKCIKPILFKFFFRVF